MSVNSDHVPAGTYSQRGFTVTIAPDGSIAVKAGDTLGGYSMAIWGNFDHLHDYSRKQNGVLVPVKNINLIYAGEILWHELSLPKVAPPEVVAPTPEPSLPKKPDGTYDVHRILEKYNLPADHYLPVSNMLNNGAQGTRAFFTLLTMFEVSIPVLSPVMAFAGPVIAVAGSVFALWKARNYGLMQVGFRASVYAMVAWAHGDSHPELPNAIKRSLVESGRPEEVTRYRDVWREGCVSGFARLDDEVRKLGCSADDLRMILRAYGKTSSLEKGDDHNKKMLAVRLLLDAAARYAPRDMDRQSFLQPWSWYPDDRYVGRPSYPPDLDAAYGW